MTVMLLSGRTNTFGRPAQVVLRLSVDDFLTSLTVKSHVSPQSDVLLLVLQDHGRLVVHAVISSWVICDKNIVHGG